MLEQIALQGSVALLYFRQVYIHSSDGRPAIDAGTRWTQEALIRIENARIDGKLSNEASEAYSVQAHCLSDGSLRIDGSASDNLIPIPLDVKGDIELTLEWSGGIVHVHGNSASLELIGTAEYVEEFHPRE